MTRVTREELARERDEFRSLSNAWYPVWTAVPTFRAIVRSTGEVVELDARVFDPRIHERLDPLDKGGPDG